MLAVGLSTLAQAVPGGAQDGPASAGASAEVLFEQGVALRKDGRCEQAIPKLEASQRLGPAVGTLLNLADCHQTLGQTASAWVRFKEAAAIARREGDGRRARFAEASAAKLTPRLSRLRIEVTAAAPELVVRRDGREVPREELGVAVPVDPGPVVVDVVAEGYHPWSETVTVPREPSQLVVTIPALEPLPPPPAPPAIEPGLGPTSIAGISLLAVGGASLLAGLGVGIRSRVLDGASDDYCPESPDVCLPEAAELRDDARRHEIAAIVLLAAGGAVAAVGGVLVWTDRAGAAEASLSPMVGPTTAGLSLSGRF